MSDFLQPTAWPSLLTVLLRKLERAPESPPFFGRVSLFTNEDKPNFAKPLNARALHSALPEYHYTKKHTVEMEIAKWSADSEMQFRSFIAPGHGFRKKGGMWDYSMKELFPDYTLEGSLVIFICGFNDKYERQTDVQNAMKEHVDWYTEQGCKIAFIEANDHHSSHVPWLMQQMQALAAANTENVCVIRSTTVSNSHPDEMKFPFPDKGWASEHNRDQSHLSEQGLRDWLPTLRDFARRLAVQMDCNKVLVVSDSTLCSHDYIPENLESCDEILVIVRATHGATSGFSVQSTANVGDLKLHMEQSSWPWAGVRIADMQLYRQHTAGNSSTQQEPLLDAETLASYGIGDGSVLMLALQGGFEDAGPVQNSPPAAFYVNSDFFDCHASKRDDKQLRLPIAAWTSEQTEHEICYCGLGHREGRTMAQEGYAHDRKTCGGVYCSPDKKVAFLYPSLLQFGSARGTECWEAIVECNVKRNAWRESGANSHLYWNIQRKDYIWPTAVILRPLPGTVGTAWFLHAQVGGASVPSESAEQAEGRASLPSAATTDLPSDSLRAQLQSALARCDKVSLSDLVKSCKASKQLVNKELYAMEKLCLARRLQESPPVWAAYTAVPAAPAALVAPTATAAPTAAPTAAAPAALVTQGACECLRDLILQVLASTTGTVALRTLVQQSDKTKKEVNRELSQLQKEGRVQKVTDEPPSWSLAP